MAANEFGEAYFRRESTYSKFTDVRSASTALARWNRAVFRLIDRMLPGESQINGPVLDVGCGHGASIRILESEKIDAIGTDVSEWLLTNLRASGEQSPLVASDAGHLPFADRSFQTVLCFEVLEHVAHPDAALAEFYRILRPGGWLMATSPNPAGDILPLFDSHRDPTHISLRSPERWAGALSSTGFLARVLTFIQPPLLWRVPGLTSPAYRLPVIGPGTLMLAQKTDTGIRA